MNIIDFISICGIIVIIIVTIIRIYNHCKINNFYRVRRRRNNRINPEILQIINNIMQERNKQHNEKEMELKIKNSNKVIIINPDNNIELGIQKM